MTPRSDSDPLAAILLVGPTASGKTAVALRLAERFPLEIVSVDSAQVYVGMDIGTAKPDPATRARVPHHLIDLISPDEAYSAGRFVTDARRLIADIRRRGRIPLLTGGTMLYVKALLDGIADLPPADPRLRAEIDAAAAERGWPALHAELARLDPSAAAGIEPQHSQRIQRALELVRLTGRPLAELYAAGRQTAPAGDFLRLALVPGERAVLHERIASRFRDMIAAGLVDEVAGLRRRYALRPEMPAMRCVGYRQVWEMQDGGSSHAKMIERGIAATRQLAKRQLTWLRSLADFTVVDPLAAAAATQIEAAVDDFVRRTGAPR